MLTFDEIINQFIVTPRRVDDLIEDLAETGDFKFLIDFASYLVEKIGSEPPYLGPYIQFLESIETKIAFDAVQVEDLISLLAVIPHEERHFREILPRLAVAQTPRFLDELAKALRRTYVDFLALLIQELVIEGVDISAYLHLKQVSEWMQEVAHPLCKLPLKLLPAERELPARTRKFPYISGPIDWSLYEKYAIHFESQTLPLAMLLKFEFEETTTPELQKRLQTAFANWSEKSNGRLDAHQFKATSRPTSKFAGNSFLLNIECLRGLENPMIITRIPGQIVSGLFIGAANGGAYNHGLGNAYGRLAVWQTIAALVNKPDETPVLELHQAMYDCQWFELEPKSPWFHDFAWDASIIAFDDSQQTLTFLSASDVD